MEGSSDGTRVAVEFIHKEEDIIIRFDFASVLDADMTAICLALKDASKTDKITIHTDSLTAVKILNNRKLYLNTISRSIKGVASRLTQRPTINWIPVHTEIPGNEKEDQAEKRCLQFNRIPTTVNASTFRIQTMIKEQMTRRYNDQAYHYASQQTKDHRLTDSSMRKLMSIPR